MTSIVILNYNTPKLTIDCIESIKRNTAEESYEIIVVDNASTDDSVSLLKLIPEEYKVKLILSEKNLGFAGGCNLGMREAKGDDICLLNSDTIVTPNWLELLKKALYSDEKIGIVGPVTNSAALQTVETPKFGGKEEIYKWAQKFNRETPLKYTRAFKLIFFCVLIKREVYRRIGGLDEHFFPGNFEDDDYSIRARMAGFRLIVAENVFIFHYGSQSFKNLKTDYQKTMDSGRERLFNKYGLSLDYCRDYMCEIYKEKNALKLNLLRILLINTGVNAVPFNLLKDYPKAEISIVTDKFTESMLLTPDFSSKWCDDVEKDLFKNMDGKYDLIYAILDIFTLDDWESFVTKIFEHLTEGGMVMLYANGEMKSFVNEGVV